MMQINEPFAVRWKLQIMHKEQNDTFNKRRNKVEMGDK